MIAPDVIRRLTVIATDNGLTALTTKLNAVDAAQDRVAISSTRMGRATELAQARIAAVTSQGGAALGGLAGSAGASMLGVVGRLAPALLGIYATYKLINETISQGAALLEKYGLAGQRALYDENNGDALAKLLKFQGDDKATLQQQKYAAELSGRLEEANRQIKEFLKVQIDLTDSALKLQNAWVVIVELMAKASRISFNNVPAAVPNTDGSWRLPGVGSDQDIINRMNRPDALSGGRPAPSFEEAASIARGRLGAGLAAGGMIGKDQSAGFYGRFNAITDKPEKEEKPAALASEYDKLEKSLQRQAAAMEAESKAVGASVGEHARLRTEMRLQEAALQDIAKNGGSMDDYAERIKKISDRLGEATQKAGELKLQNDLTFDRSQIGRDPIEANVASRLRPIYGDDYTNQMNSAAAAGIRFNEQMRQAKDLTTEFATGFAGEFRNELRRGESAFQALGNAGMSALTRLSDKLMDMAVSNLVAKAFGGSGGGGFFSLFGPQGPGMTPGLSPGDSGFIGPVQVGTGRVGGMVGSLPTTWVHPAYFDNAPHMRGGGMITDDGVPIIAHPGERILNRQETAAYSGGKSAGVHYHDNRTFNDVTPAVEARMEARMRAERPKIIAEVMAAMKKQRGRDPNTYGAG